MTFESINQNRLIRNFRKDKGLIGISIAGVVLVSAIYLVTAYKPSYHSETKVWIKDTSPDAYYVAPFDTESPIKPLTTAGNPILTQLEILKSHELSLFVTDYLRQKYPAQYSSTKTIPIKSVLKAKNPTGTDIIDLQVSMETPEDAQALMQAVVDKYIELNTDMNRDKRSKRREYLDARLAEVEGKLLSVRRQIQQYKTGALSANIEEESKDIVLLKNQFISRLSDIQAKRHNLQNNARELEHQLQLSPKQAVQAVAIGSNESLIKLRAQLDEAQQQYAFDRVKYAEANPKLIAQQRKISTIQSEIQKQLKRSIGETAVQVDPETSMGISDPVRQRLIEKLVDTQSEAIGLAAEQHSLEASLAQVNRDIAQLPINKFNLDNLTQEEKALSTAYDELRKRQIEARLKEVEVEGNAQVVDPPSLPDNAAFPKQWHVLVLSIILGGILGLGLSLLKTFLEDQCDEPDALEHATRTPILGILPWVNQETPGNTRQELNQFAYQNIASNLALLKLNQNARVITFMTTAAVKSPMPHIRQVAEQLKQMGHSVIVMNEGPSNTLKASTKTTLLGFSPNLSKAYRQPLKSNGDSRLPHSADSRQTSTALLTKGQPSTSQQQKPLTFFKKVTSLQQEYDFVLVDGPSTASPEFWPLSKQTDGVVLFVGKTTTLASLRKLNRKLAEKQIKLFGYIVREAESEFKKRVF